MKTEIKMEKVVREGRKLSYNETIELTDKLHIELKKRANKNQLYTLIEIVDFFGVLQAADFIRIIPADLCILTDTSAHIKTKWEEIKGKI